MTRTYEVRLSPSGRRLGNPPLLTGPGATGRQWRRHGLGATGDITSDAGSLDAIPGMEIILVDIRPGYLYDLEVDYELIASALTGTVTWHAFYRLRNTANVWSAWVAMSGSAHEMRGDVTAFSDVGMFADANFNISATAVCNAIEFSLLSGITGDPPMLNPALAFARVVEYMP